MFRVNDLQKLTNNTRRLSIWKYSFSLKIFLIVVGLGLGTITFNYIEAQYYKSLIPTDIEIDGKYFISTDTDYWRLSCGVIAFMLTDKAVNAIKRKDLTYFLTARIAEANQFLFGTNKRISYSKWKKTPLPSESLSNGLHPGFSCADEPKKGLFNEIYLSMAGSGNYYARGISDINRNAMIYVLPDMQLILYIFWND